MCAASEEMRPAMKMNDARMKPRRLPIRWPTNAHSGMKITAGTRSTPKTMPNVSIPRISRAKYGAAASTAPAASACTMKAVISRRKGRARQAMRNCCSGEPELVVAWVT